MEKRPKGVIIKGNTPLHGDRPMDMANQIKNNFSILAGEKIGKDQIMMKKPKNKDKIVIDEFIKSKNEYTLQKNIGPSKNTRRSSFLNKEQQSLPFRIRPSSKRLPPLKEQNKESFSKKEIILNKILLDIPPPFVTCRSWAVVNGSNGDLLFGKLEREHREIASLTKIMVGITTLYLGKHFEFNLKTETIQVTNQTTYITGTSAYLKEDDILTIWDLLHGLMLPSGNDGGFLLADYFGRLLKKSGKYK